MNQIAPQNRLQVQMISLEDAISATNPVRLIDCFVQKLDLPRIGFAVRPPRTEGRPAFNERVFLALYLYGYQNGVRSSRALERDGHIADDDVHRRRQRVLVSALRRAVDGDGTESIRARR